MRFSRNQVIGSLILLALILVFVGLRACIILR